MEVVIAIVVVLLSVSLALWGAIYYRKKQAKDDVYEHFSQKARSISWFATLATIILFFVLIIYGNVNLNIIPAMSILMLVHIGSWGIALVIFMMNALSE